MTTLKLKFRLPTIIGLFAIIAISVSMIIWTTISFFQKLNMGQTNIIFPFFVLVALFIAILILVFFTLKIITVTDKKIEYYYILFPLKTYRIEKKNLDGIAIVMEKRKSVIGVSNFPVLFNFPDKEAIWFFEDKKFTLRASSIVYENYQELKFDLNDLVKLDIKIETSLDQLLFMTRIKKLPLTAHLQ